MDIKSWPLTFGALAAVFAVLFAQGAPAPSEKQAEEPVAAATSEESPAPAPPAKTECQRWCEPIRLYEEYFGLPTNGSLGLVVATASHLYYKLDVLVALIPDPVDSGLSYRSDEALEAIQRGFAEEGFLFDRQWLPWQGDAAKAKRYRREPGALLFRRSSSRELTLVLLVGETPKGGLHKAAFQEALALAERLHPRARRTGPIRILGPTFSGTMESLRISLRLWLDREADQGGPPEPSLGPVRFRIVTGSATARGLENVIAEHFGTKVRLERTIVPDDELERQAYAYLEKELGWDFENVALLSEFDTGYGQGARIRVQETGRRQEGPRPRFLVEFPSHLARLRTAREKKGLRENGSDAKQVAESAPKLLDPSLAEEGEEPVDLIPQISSLATANDDLALANQLKAVCREGVRYIGIVATALQDRLFLADLVRSHCPDVLLFTFDSHLLASHPQFTKSMQGSLVLTSYPLVITANEKREPDSRDGVRIRRQYGSELQQGIVLAVRRLLENKLEQPREQPRPWIAAVGNGHLWPVVRLEEEKPKKSLGVAASAQRFTIAGTEGVAFKWITASGVIALLAFWLWSTARPVQRLDGELWLPPGGIPGARFFPLVGMATLALACGVLLVFYSLPLWNQSEFQKGFLSGRVAAWGLNFLALALVYMILIFACAGLLRAPSPHRRGHWRAVWFAGALLLLLVLQKAFLDLWVLPEGEEFFYARAADFAGGLSPLVSLACLLAAVYGWALLGIRRRRMALLQEMTWPLVPAAADEPLATCGRLAAKVDNVLWRWFPGPWFWAGLAVALLLPLRRLTGIQPVTEPASYGWVFLALVGLGFTLGAIAFYRFILVWWRLERVLELLCHTWLLGTFSKSSGFFDWKPLRSFGWRLPRHRMSLLSTQALRTLTRHGVLGADGAALAPAGALDRGIGAVIQAEVDKDLETEVRARMELQKWFVKSAHTLERARPQLPAGEEEVAAEVDKFLSLRVVGWIRYVFGHLRYSLISAMVCGLFLLVGVSAYAFQPKRFLSFGLWTFLLVMSLLTLRIFMRMDRNAVLSAIGGSEAGKVSFDRTFFSNLFTYGGIPVIGVVLTQFPAVASLLGDWLQPLLRLLTAS